MHKDIDNSTNINKGFSKISHTYEELNHSPNLITWMRKRIYSNLLKSTTGNSILEINCGTGIDAVYLSKEGYTVHATDISDGMLAYVKTKIETHKLQGKLSCQKLNLNDLNVLQPKKFNHIFSNFGGLNCVAEINLKTILNSFTPILESGGGITLVIMPKLCFWECFQILKLKKHAFRRFKKNGVEANVEGEKIKTYYHNKKTVINFLQSDYKNFEVESICAFGPTGNKVDFPKKHPFLFKIVRKIDILTNKLKIFQGIGDYYIISAIKK